jgi:hypothetical protein
MLSERSGTDILVTRCHVPEERGPQLFSLKTVELAASRSTACNDISVMVLWLSIPHFCLNQFSHYSCPIWQALFVFSSYALIKKRLNLCIFLLFQDGDQYFWKKKLQTTGKHIKIYSYKKPRNYRVNLWVINSNNSFANTGGNLNSAYFKL